MNTYCKTILLFILLFVNGCVTVPSLRVSQPWVRSLKSNQVIDPTKAVKIEVSGSTSPLLGNEQLTSEQLNSSLTHLITRRGFTVNSRAYDYVVKLSYKTDRNDKMRLSSTVTSAHSQAYMISTTAGVGTSSGLGVSIARAIGALASRSSTVASQSADQTPSYTHTIAIELSNRDGAILWKGESTWDSEELNLISGIIPALQLILSNLPADRSVRPEIPEVKETHVTNYYRLECVDVWFTCPALPYRILFADFSSSSPYRGAVPDRVLNQNAFATYVDLIQTSEYALPDGDENDWKDPLDVSLWKKVTLGGQYLLGPQKTPVNIIIELTGQSDGYYINRCKIATDTEYLVFSAKLARWREILTNYYDFYQK
ncbi:MAG TPA: hypothetical protein VMF88_13245 [Bacteroidota bacterium]|nr:hypothetical protein [Bacteroidota bacterium]